LTGESNLRIYKSLSIGADWDVINSSR